MYIQVVSLPFPLNALLFVLFLTHYTRKLSYTLHEPEETRDRGQSKFTIRPLLVLNQVPTYDVYPSPEHPQKRAWLPISLIDHAQVEAPKKRQRERKIEKEKASIPQKSSDCC